MRDRWTFRPLRLHAAGRAEHPHKKKTDQKLFLLACALLVGVIFGSIYEATGASNRYIAYFVRQYLNGVHGGGFAAAASGTFLSSMAMQAVVLFFSLSCIGAPVLIFLPFLRGVFIGCVSAYLYSGMGSRGLLANLLMLWVPEVLRALLLIFFIAVAWDTSVGLFRLNFLAQTPGPEPRIRRCLRCFVLVSFGMLPISLLEGALSAVFAPVLLELSV